MSRPVPPSPGAATLQAEQTLRRELQLHMARISRLLPATARITLVCEDVPAIGQALVLGADVPDLIHALQRRQSDRMAGR